MDNQITEELNFEDVVGKVGFEAALMLFPDQIPEAVSEKFTTGQWLFIFASPISSEKLKELAWENIEKAALTFEQSKIFFWTYNNPKIRARMLDSMCLLAEKDEEIVGCLSYLTNDDPRRPEFFDKLSKVDDPFPVLAKVFHNINTRETDLQDAVFGVIEKAEASFEQWQDFNRGFSRSLDLRYLLKRLKAMRKRADTFNRKWQTYTIFEEYELLATEISVLLQDLADTAESVRELDWVYSVTRSEKIKAKILTTSGDFDDWPNIYSTTDEDWLVELSLQRMRELAKIFEHSAILWCKESLPDNKNEAASRMIDLASDVGEGKLALHRALGTDLEEKAREKLRQIISAL